MGKKEIDSQHKRSFDSHSRLSADRLSDPWIEQKITQLECAKFVASKRFTKKCGCGRLLEEHDSQVQHEELHRLSVMTNSPLANFSEDRMDPPSAAGDRWQVKTCTKAMPTNSYGTVEFHAGPHPTRAKYVRINYDTRPELVVHLLLREWKLRVPSLVISTIGGLANCCPLQTKLLKVVQSGILRAAKTTGAWVITNGLDTGVTKHIGEALKDEIHVRGSNIVALGIAPWGVVQNREQLVGLDHTSSYHWQEKSNRQQQEIPLNPHHNYFLLTDNGTSGKFGSEFFLRRKLEQYLAQQPIDWRRFGSTKSRVPVIGVLIEGGSQTFRTVFELVTGRNPVPIVVCDGSGRAADLLAFMHRFSNDEGELTQPLLEQITTNLCRTFQISRCDAETLCLEMKFCMKRKDLISVFRMGEGASDEIDIAILTALLQASGQNLTPAEQLSLTMAWNRSDIARSKVFKSSVEWPMTTLESAMTDALLNDRLEFVQLILEKGLSMKKFLTVNRLEELYSIAYSNTSKSLYRLFVKFIGARPRITLRLVGQLIENLVGGGYQHPYSVSKAQVHFKGHSASFSSDLNGFSPNFDMPRLSVNTKMTNFENSHPSIYKSIYRASQATIFSLKSSTRFGSNHLDNHTTVTSNFVNSNGDNNKSSVGQNFGCLSEPESVGRVYHFRYPYTELLQWALLSKKYELARYMVLSGEESIAKALISVKILRGLRKAVDADSEVEFTKELKEWEEKFERLAVELQAHCYRHDAEQAKRLLTYELKTFSKNTCLSLAYLCESKLFIAHPCTQSILNDLWYGGLREGKFVGAKVALILLGLSIPPIYPLIAYFFTKHSKFLEFKTKEELAKQPQTFEEFLEEQNDTSSSDSSTSSLSDLSSKNSDNDRKISDIDRKQKRKFRKRLSMKAKNRSPSDADITLPSDDPIIKIDRKKDETIQEEGDENKNIEINGESYLETIKRKSSIIFRKTKAKKKFSNGKRVSESSCTSVVTNELDGSPKKVTLSKQLTDQELKNGSLISKNRRPTATSCSNQQPIRSNLAVLLPNTSHYSSVASSETYPNPRACNKEDTAEGMNVGNRNLGSISNPVHLMMDGIMMNMLQSTPTPRKHLSFRKKIYEFFSAPVTRFYLHVHLYVFFLLLYIGLCIHTVPRESFSWLELYVYLHIITYFLDKFREITLNPGNFYVQKFRVHMESFWNIYDLMMCSFSVIGIFVRYLGLVFPDLYMWGKNWLILCCALWQMRFLELMQIWRFSGPYIYMLVKMLRVMVPMLSLLFFPLVAFGTIRQGIMMNNATEIDLTGIKGILLKPYFMLYGEVYAGEIDPVDWNIDLTNAPLFEAVPIAMVIYLLYSIVLLLSVLIATFNDVFTTVLAQSELVYKYLRYAVIIEYESRPLLPPPFIIISWVYSLVKTLYRKKMCCSRRLSSDSQKNNSNSIINENNDENFARKSSSVRNIIIDQSKTSHLDSAGLNHSFDMVQKLFLDQDEVEKLHDFEEECVEDYWRETKRSEKSASANHLDKINSKLDQINFSVNEFHLRQTQLRGAVCLLEEEMATIADNTYSQLINLSNSTNRLIFASENAHQNTSSFFSQKGLTEEVRNPAPQLVQQTSVNTAGPSRKISYQEMNSTVQYTPSETETDNKLIMTTLLTLLKRNMDMKQTVDKRPQAMQKNIPMISLDPPEDISNCKSLNDLPSATKLKCIPTSSINKKASSFSSIKATGNQKMQNQANETDDDPLENVLKLLCKRLERSMEQQKEPNYNERVSVVSQTFNQINHQPLNFYQKPDKYKYRMMTTGFRQRLANLSSRLADATNREYTTICDDIDLSCLNQMESPETSPFGSQNDISLIENAAKKSSHRHKKSKKMDKTGSEDSEGKLVKICSEASLDDIESKDGTFSDEAEQPIERVSISKPSYERYEANEVMNSNKLKLANRTRLISQGSYGQYSRLNPNGNATRPISIIHESKSAGYSFSKDEELMRAEDMERAELEGVLLKRLRQLSVSDERSLRKNSISLNSQQKDDPACLNRYDPDQENQDYSKQLNMINLTDMNAYLSSHIEDDEVVNMELDPDIIPITEDETLDGFITLNSTIPDNCATAATTTAKDGEKPDTCESAKRKKISNWKQLAKDNFRAHISSKPASDENKKS